MSRTLRLRVGGVAADATLTPSGAISAPVIAVTAIAILAVSDLAVRI
jgi:hypothetical protein